jgi:hypothetical protein
VHTQSCDIGRVVIMLCLKWNLSCVAAIYRRRHQHSETAIRQSSCGATRILDVCVGFLQYTGSSVAPADPQIPEAKYAPNISLICGLLGLNVSSFSPPSHSATTTHPRPQHIQQSWGSSWRCRCAQKTSAVEWLQDLTESSRRDPEFACAI